MKLSLSDWGLNHVIQKSWDVQSKLKALVINMAKLTAICWLTLQSVSQKKFNTAFLTKKASVLKVLGCFKGCITFINSSWLKQNLIFPNRKIQQQKPR